MVNDQLWLCFWSRFPAGVQLVWPSVIRPHYCCSPWAARTNIQRLLPCAILLSFYILMDRTFNYLSCQIKLKLSCLTCFFLRSRCSTEVTKGQFQTNSLESLMKTRLDGNSDSAWTRLLRLLAVLEQFYRWMLVPNHNYLINVMFPLCGCELLNWIVRSSIHTWNPVVVLKPCGLQSGNCWLAHIEY